MKESHINTAYFNLVGIRDYFYLDWVFFDIFYLFFRVIMWIFRMLFIIYNFACDNILRNYKQQIKIKEIQY